MNARLAALVTALLAFAACSNTVDTQKLGADRTVVITMKDNHFEPDRVEVDRGETVAFRFVNRGRNTHDAFIGDADEQDEHERKARMADDAGHDAHATGNLSAVTVGAGEMSTLVHKFSERGTTLIGCHEPGHYEDGMVVTLTVA